MLFTTRTFKLDFLRDYFTYEDAVHYSRCTRLQFGLELLAKIGLDN